MISIEAYDKFHRALEPGDFVIQCFEWVTLEQKTVLMSMLVENYSFVEVQLKIKAEWNQFIYGHVALHRIEIVTCAN